MENQQPRRSTRRWVIVALAALILSLPIAVFGVAVSSNIYFLEESVTETEDVYVTLSPDSAEVDYQVLDWLDLTTSVDEEGQSSVGIAVEWDY